jgi:hypothetical protein
MFLVSLSFLRATTMADMTLAFSFAAIMPLSALRSAARPLCQLVSFRLPIAECLSYTLELKAQWIFCVACTSRVIETRPRLPCK